MSILKFVATVATAVVLAVLAGMGTAVLFGATRVSGSGLTAYWDMSHLAGGLSIATALAVVWGGFAIAVRWSD